MEAEIDAKLSQYFAKIADPRCDHTRRHLMIDIIVIAICVVIAGADDSEAVAEFRVAREGWLRRF